MIKSSIEGTGKGWFVGPWNSKVPAAVDFSHRGFDYMHFVVQVPFVHGDKRSIST